MEKQQKPKHNWTENEYDKFTLLFDTGLEKAGTNGIYFIWSVDIEGKGESVFFASPDLNDRILQTGARKSSSLQIRKNVESGRFLSWDVELVGGSVGDYVDVKSGNVAPQPFDGQANRVNLEPDWDEIGRNKQLNIIAGQSMNLAVKTALSIDGLDLKNYKLEVIKYRDMYFQIMAEFKILDPLVETKEEEKDDLPF